MSIDREHFIIREHCHVNQNGDGDRFVGVKADSNGVMIYFPIGYQLPDHDDELRLDIKNLFQILANFTEETNKVLEMDKVTAPRSVAFPILAYMNVINYYLDHDGSYYMETEKTYKVNMHGKTNWGRTIKTQTPLIQGKSLIYLNQVVRVSSPDMNRLITRIHRYCVYEAFDRIGWLYTRKSPEQPDITFDKNMFVSVLNAKLDSTNDDDDKNLFRSMIAMINFVDSQTSDKKFFFGTDTFETVWEKLIDTVFGISNKNDYFPHGLWKERFGANKGRPASALEPDSIMIYDGKYYVLDAKYYRYGILPKLGSSILPQSSDINKQITYGQFVKNQRAPKGAQVFNAFVMPYNKDNNDFNINRLFGNVAEATGDWIADFKDLRTHERIQCIVLDTRYLMKNYDGNHDSEKAELAKEIEGGIKSSFL